MKNELERKKNRDGDIESGRKWNKRGEMKKNKDEKQIIWRKRSNKMMGQRRRAR
jgi:hypothetical protein